MTPQRNLFDDILGKNARKSDPQPSKTAAKKMNQGKRQTNMDIVLDVMRRHAKGNGRALTSRELYFNYEQYFRKHGLCRYEVSRRLSDLKNKQYAEGKRLIKMEQDPIYCSISHKSLSAYSAVI